MFKNEIKEINIDYKNYYEFVINEKNIKNFNSTLTENINYKNFIS